jgi:hypothetical protein
MVTGSDEEDMEKSRGRRAQYTWLVMYCLGGLYMEAIRSLNKRRGVVGFTQAAIRDCVRRYVNVANPDIIKNAIYDAESHGWVARVRAHKRGRDLFVPTKPGLMLFFIITAATPNLILTDLPTLGTLAESFFTSPDRAREVLGDIVTPLKFLLDGIISQLKGYRSILARKGGSVEFLRVSKRLAMLEEIRNAVSGYNKEAPTTTDAIRFANVINYLYNIVMLMKLMGLGALCYVVGDIIDRADPVTWSENVLG